MLRGQGISATVRGRMSSSIALSRPPQDHLLRRKIFPLGSRNNDQFVDWDIHLLRKTFGGFRRSSGSVIGHGLRRPRHVLCLVRLFDAKARARRNQPARRAVDFDGRALRQIMGASNISQVLLSVLLWRPATSPPGFLRIQFQIESPLSPSSRDPRNRRLTARFRLLREKIDGHPAGDLADAANQLGALGGGDDPAGVKQVEEVGTLQTMVIGRE